MSVTEHADINTHIVEYLRTYGMSKTADCIEKEIQSTSVYIQASTLHEKQKYTRKGWNYQG